MAYILGQQGFWKLDLEVAPHTLIPRPETETVVQAGIDWLTRERLSTPRIVDLCAGSGAIGLSLVTEVRGAQVWAVEKVPRTYDWTMRNWRWRSRASMSLPAPAPRTSFALSPRCRPTA